MDRSVMESGLAVMAGRMAVPVAGGLAMVTLHLRHLSATGVVGLVGVIMPAMMTVMSIIAGTWWGPLAALSPPWMGAV